jgi:dTDP-4-amino-4,6-dideoxygalactose transaminase
MKRTIPYARQEILPEDVEAVVKVLGSDFITQGPMVAEFEAAVAARFGARHAVAVATGTAALHAACFAAGVGPGDEVVTSPITFVASANCARYLGAEVRFADVQPDSACMAPDASAASWARRRRP